MSAVGGSMTDPDDFDVVVVGAGPAGLSFAASLRASGLRVVIVEKQGEAQLADPAYDGREIALTWRSVRLLRELGIWQRLPAEQIFAIRGARVLDGLRVTGLEIRPPQRLSMPAVLAANAPATQVAAPADAGELGYLVSNHLLRRAAYAAVRADSPTLLLLNATVQAVTTHDHQATVTLAGGRVLRGRLLVAADSRFSETRRALGIPARHLDFGKTMLVCRMQHSVSHEHIACEWFGHHQTLAALPLGDHQSSIVLTLPHTQIERLCALGAQDFEREMRRRFLDRLGSMQLQSERFAYPLVAVYPDRFITTRCATIGDAAVGMHPVTAHGFNLGLEGQDTLAKLILRDQARTAGWGNADPGASTLLRAYDAAHRRASRPLYLATNAIVRLYTDDSPPARWVRGALLQIASRAPLLSARLSRALMQSH